MFVFFKITIVFISIILLTRRYSLGISLLIGSFLIGILFMFNFSSWIDLLSSTLASSSMWQLFFIFITIGIFASSMEVSGSLDEMINNLHQLISNPKIIIALAPMLIGMVNLPGGAYISAPFVEKASKNLNLTQEEKSSINIIFRHFWYPVYPVFPAIILLHELSEVPINKIVLLGIPSVIISLIISWWVCFKNIVYIYNHNLNGKNKLIAFKKFFRAVMPLIVIVNLVLFINMSVISALLIGILSVILLNFRIFSCGFGESKKTLTNILLKGIKWKILIIPFGIFLFRNALDKSEVVDMLLPFLSHSNISILIPTLFFSALIAFFTAYHLAAISISAPFIIPLLSSDIYDIGVFFLLIGTIIGYLISPLHTCIVLSNDYFNANYMQTIVKVMLCGLGILIGAIIVALIFI